MKKWYILFLFVVCILSLTFITQKNIQLFAAMETDVSELSLDQYTENDKKTVHCQQKQYGILLLM